MRGCTRKMPIKVVGIPSSVGDTALQGKVCQLLRETGVEVAERDM